MGEVVDESPTTADRNPNPQEPYPCASPASSSSSPATVAALAVPSVASANVASTSGVGHVGKGDVQSALELQRRAMQSAVQIRTVKFTADVENIVDYKMTMLGAASPATVLHPALEDEVEAVARTNRAGKFWAGT